MSQARSQVRYLSNLLLFFILGCTPTGAEDLRTTSLDDVSISVSSTPVAETLGTPATTTSTITIPEEITPVAVLETATKRPIPSLAPSLVPAKSQSTPTGLTSPEQVLEAQCADIHDVPSHECLALARLYLSTQGKQWTNADGWFTNPDLCEWSGVKCEDGHVAKLNLAENNLTGELPESISQLTQLRHLYLQTNSLTGAISGSLGKLISLQVLLLSDNQLSGTLPAELGQLNKLLSFYIDGNALSGVIPPSLGEMQNIRYLYLNGNQFEGSVPATLGNLVKISDLHLYENRLSGPLPESLAKIEGLQHIKLHENEGTLCLPQTLNDWAEQRAIFTPPPGGLCLDDN